MTLNSSATGQVDADPDLEDQDTQDDDQQADTEAPNTQTAQQPTDDWQERYTNLQSWSSTEIRKLQDQLIAEREDRQAAGTVDPTDPNAVERARQAKRDRELAEREALIDIRERAPRELVTGFDEYRRAKKLDPSPKGEIAAFEAGLRAFAMALPQQQQAEKPKPKLPTRAEAVKPRVDTTRSAAPDPAAIDEQIAGMKGRDSLIASVRHKFGMPALEPRRRA